MTSVETSGLDWPGLNRSTRTVVVVDLVESVRLMQIDEAGVIDRWRRFLLEARQQLLPPLGGRMVKSLGDGMLLEFAEARKGMAAALALHRRVQGYNSGQAPDRHLLLRIGAHQCEVVSDEHDIYGRGVNLAARLSSLAQPGQTVVSAALRDLLVQGVDASFVDLGHCHVRHLAEPVHAYRLHEAGADPIAPPPPVDDKPRLAVLPFRCVGSDPAYGELIADGLACTLGSRQELAVLSRLSTSSVAGRVSDLHEAARLLNASHLLCGTVHSVGSRLRVFAELIDMRSDAQLCCQQFLVPEADLFSPDSALVSEFSRLVVALMCAAESARVLNHALPNLPSYTLQLGAIGLMHQASGQHFDEAASILDHLAARHSRSVTPHVWLAKHAILRLTRGQAGKPEAEAEAALSHTQHALAIDPHNALALATEGFVHCHLRHDLPAARQRLEQATQAQPSEAMAWLFKAVVLSFQAEHEQGWTAATRALQLSPLDPLRYYFESLAASVALTGGLYAQALQLCDSSLALNRRHSSTWRAKAIALVQTGAIDAAREAMRQHQQLEPAFTLTRYQQRSPASGTPLGELLLRSLREAGAPD